MLKNDAPATSLILVSSSRRNLPSLPIRTVLFRFGRILSLEGENDDEVCLALGGRRSSARVSLVLLGTAVLCLL